MIYFNFIWILVYEILPSIIILLSLTVAVIINILSSVEFYKISINRTTFLLYGFIVIKCTCDNIQVQRRQVKLNFTVSLNLYMTFSYLDPI